MPCTEIQADWGAQRIKNLSLLRAATEALKPKWLRERQGKAKQVTSLIEEFNYPKLGPGMMWERCTERITAQGTKVVFDSNVTKVEHSGGRAVAVTANTAGADTRYECTHVISSMPIGALLRAMDPPVPQSVLDAANALRYRDFITVALVVPETDGFPDNWIYINDPSVKVGRIQNFGQWSPYLVKDGRTCLGLELFVNEGDEWWTMSDADLIENGKRELEQIGLVDADRVEAGYVTRMPKAYPFYDAHYKENVAKLAAWLEEHAPNVLPVGRNGMHRYNNQDHSMLTAMLSVENIFGAHHDIWSVNVEAEYHEESAQPAGECARVVTSRSPDPLGAQPSCSNRDRCVDGGRRAADRGRQREHGRRRVVSQRERVAGREVHDHVAAVLLRAGARPECAARNRGAVVHQRDLVDRGGVGREGHPVVPGGRAPSAACCRRRG